MIQEPTNPTASGDEPRSRAEGIRSPDHPTPGAGVGSEPAPFSLSQLQAEVGKWHREQFRDIDPLACLLKAMSELGELADIDCAALENQTGARWRLPGKTRHEEVADVFVSLLGYCERLGIDAEEALRVKWEIVKRRDYRGRG